MIFTQKPYFTKKMAQIYTAIIIGNLMMLSLERQRELISGVLVDILENELSVEMWEEL